MCKHALARRPRWVWACAASTVVKCTEIADKTAVEVAPKHGHGDESKVIKLGAFRPCTSSGCTTYVDESALTAWGFAEALTSGLGLTTVFARYLVDQLVANAPLDA